MFTGMDFKFMENAKRLGVVTDINERWEKGMDHHPMSKQFRDLVGDIEKEHGGDLMLDFGGDGDNGEDVLYLLDIMFETQQKLAHEAMTVMHLAILPEHGELAN